MVDIETLRTVVAKGLKEYLKCPVIRSNQNAAPPKYPYISYTIITPTGENNGTYGEYEDGKARKPVDTTISYSALSDDNIESFTLANKAKEWLDYVATLHLTEKGVIVQSVTGVTNRDNVLTSEYEHKNGFDCVFSTYEEIEIPDYGVIESIEFGDMSIETPPTTEELNEMLEQRLSGEVV